MSTLPTKYKLPQSLNWLEHRRHYQWIKKFYGEERAKRSMVPLINHINEGLVILEHLQASHNEKFAFCLHPIFQADEDLLNVYYGDELSSNRPIEEAISPYVMILIMEYRYRANNYLSHHEEHGSTRGPNPGQLMHNMLIADKVQNYKDFLIYHAETHDNAEVLDSYFQKWFRVLGVSDADYKELIRVIEDKRVK